MIQSSNPTKQYDEISHAYIAGLFDGEGCVYISAPADGVRDTKYQLVVSLSNNHRGVIAEICDLYGGHMQELKQGRKNTNFVMYLRSAKAGEFLRSILPYLYIKREQAELALEFQEHMTAQAHAGKSGVPVGAREYRQTCHEEMKRLKRSYFVPGTH